MRWRDTTSKTMTLLSARRMVSPGNPHTLLTHASGAFEGDTSCNFDAWAWAWSVVDTTIADPQQVQSLAARIQSQPWSHPTSTIHAVSTISHMILKSSDISLSKDMHAAWTDAAISTSQHALAHTSSDPSQPRSFTKTLSILLLRSFAARKDEDAANLVLESIIDDLADLEISQWRTYITEQSLPEPKPKRKASSPVCDQPCAKSTLLKQEPTTLITSPKPQQAKISRNDTFRPVLKLVNFLCPYLSRISKSTNLTWVAANPSSTLLALTILSIILSLLSSKSPRWSYISSALWTKLRVAFGMGLNWNV